MRSSILATILLSATCLAVGCDKAKADQPTKRAAAAAAPVEHAGPAPAASLEGTRYGDGVTTDDPGAIVSIDALLADPRAYEGKTVRVEGMVTDVCPKRGCWMDLAGEGPGQKVRFKVTDGVMTFPMEAKGTRAVAQGTVAVKMMTLEESRDYAAYQAKEYGAEIDPASITEPTMIVRIDGTGAVLRDPR